jgi:glycosyltransferase involved in cell wall biosynthesis
MKAAVAPRVSIIVPFFNAARFFDTALDSIFGQTVQDWELLLIDDGSHDASTTRARRAAEEHPQRVRYLEHPAHANRGQAASRNLGIAAAHGTYLAFLDSDDVWLPEKLERQIPILDSHPEVAMVYGPLIFWYSWPGNEICTKGDFSCPMGDRYHEVIAPPTMLLRQIEQTDGLPGTCSVLLRREVAMAVGGYEESFGMYEDETFFAKIALRYPVYVMDIAYDRYRQHSDSFSAKAIVADDYAWTQGAANKSRGRFLRWLVGEVSKSHSDDRVLLRAIERQLEPYRAAAENGDATA